MNLREEKMSDEFKKYHVENSRLKAVFHEFTAPDKGGPHCHPFRFKSFVLQGSYVEKVYVINPNGLFVSFSIERKEGDSFYIEADHIHEIVSIPEGVCYTMIRPEKKVKESKFWKFEGNKIFHRQWNETEFKLYEI